MLLHWALTGYTRIEYILCGFHDWCNIAAAAAATTAAGSQIPQLELAIVPAAEDSVAVGVVLFVVRKAAGPYFRWTSE